MFPALALIVIFTFIGLLSGFSAFLIWNAPPDHEPDVGAFVLCVLLFLICAFFIIGLGKDFRLSYRG